MSDAVTWEAVIGLEVHVELNTKSKLFSSALNRFGDEPNTNISEVCTGQPGALPLLNREAVRKAVQLGCALGSSISRFSTFDRKSYFYPDSPRNFQITQYSNPIIVGGEVVVEIEGKEKRFALDHAHLEDDAGMLKHFKSFSGVDYNRAGVPLIEIVSKPCMHLPKEAVAYAMALRAILVYIGASDCNMEEGSLRIDANVSVRPSGSPLRPKIEIKNMNSFSNMEMALECEIERQIALYEAHPEKLPEQVIQQATCRWDGKQTVLMRSKEQAADYRYFPEPDLLPIVLSEEFILEVSKTLPELPLERTRRYIEQLGLPPDTAFILTSDKPTADYFEEALKGCGDARQLCNWIIVEFAGRFKESGKSLIQSGIEPLHVAHLVNMIETGTITGKIAKSVADLMVAYPGKDSRTIVAENPDFQPLHDREELQRIIDEVIAENQESVEAIALAKASGREPRAFGFLVGQVMKKTRGTASPPAVNELLKGRLEL